MNFFLCPSEGMVEAIFPLIHPIFMLPTYRTFLANLMLLLSFPLCYLYVYIAYVIRYIVYKVYNSGIESDMNKKLD